MHILLTGGCGYIVPERKPRNMVFQFCLEISNSLRLLSFFNSKLKTKNSKQCLNGIFVQALSMLVLKVKNGKFRFVLNFAFFYG